MRRLAALLVIIAATLCLACPRNRPPDPEPGPPKPIDIGELIRVVCPALAADPAKLADVARMCNVVSRVEAVLCVSLACRGIRPVPRATATVVPKPTQTVPKPTQTAEPETWTDIVNTPCLQSANDRTLRPVFAGPVRAAQESWLAANPGKWRQHGPLPSVAAEYHDTFYFGVAANLRAAGLQAVVDSCRCGEIAVSAAGLTFHEQYHVLISNSGDVHWPLVGGDGTAAAGFRARCEPRGFQPLGNSEGLPTVAPTASAVCPPLLTINIFKLGGNSKFYGDGRWCQILNATPRFLVNGKEVPGNGEHPIPGLGDTCEPRPADVIITVHAGAGIFGQDKDYLAKACGADGSAFDATATLKPGALDKGGRPVDLSHFDAYVMRGVI